ncbi:membrane protein [Thermosipho melanesiensis]|uniref:Probable membrane transporter protein n=2 Tax=Thermosipho melanesiensis TaxID=46541 RepID=A6LNR0_THEM4|nr:TSUP family transporter [Thermosipho melanesiensis]ABR31561.1 protein of unknown function DUF81 [Thermosipho melanesiensis BI429]APT74593.1 membrane protein [Thermosipho melanesiensis]OOC35298.1 membrane protein [Thermosipho melanesiensis]OOC35517.1 membrane protein [Thermosipho melanesiensis]OOC36553.1 membrane protein [Thermosipho melanesiensis]
MVNFTISDMFILFPLIFFAGFVDSIAGGGGLISLPAYLLIGLPSHNALATNKLSSSIGTMISTFKYGKRKYIVFEIAIFSIIFSFLGSYVGASIALMISENRLRLIISILIVIAGIFLTLKKIKLHDGINLRISKKIIASLIGFFIGMYDGFLGPGTGTFLIILYVNVLSLDYIKASGTTKIVNLASNTSALVTFLVNGKVLFYIGFPAALFSILGNWIGASLAIKNKEKLIKPVILGVLFLLATKVVHDIV